MCSPYTPGFFLVAWIIIPFRFICIPSVSGRVPHECCLDLVGSPWPVMLPVIRLSRPPSRLRCSRVQPRGMLLVNSDTQPPVTSLSPQEVSSFPSPQLCHHFPSPLGPSLVAPKLPLPTPPHTQDSLLTLLQLSPLSARTPFAPTAAIY